MGEHKGEQTDSGFYYTTGRLLFICLVLAFLGLIVLFPPNSTRADSTTRAAFQPQQAENDVYLPIVYRNFSVAPVETPTSTPTPTSTVTSTGTQTVTGTPPTSTPTLTGTPPTSTPTGTTTTTGTPPTQTPTATGTIVANPLVDITVSPFQANIGQNFTFSIKVTNNGTAPATNAILSDPFPDYMDIQSVTTSKGTQNFTIHNATVNIGIVSPGEEVNITIVARANSRKTTTETVSNTVYFYYGSNQSKTDVVSFRIVVSTLPGTGELPLDWEEASNDPLLTVQVLLMGGLGVVLVGLGIWAWRKDSTNRYWLLGIGIILLVVSSAALFAEMQNRYISDESSLIQPPANTSGEGTSDQASSLPEATPSEQVRLPAYLFATPEHTIIETLPSFPIPSPDITFTPVPEIAQADTSAVERIIIPAILLDTEVKYVPFDGFSWLIRGLRYEIAWLGDTSWPGLGGNTVLAGHVTVSGIGNGPFRRLEELVDGEFIFLQTEENTYTYRVRGRSIVDDWDLSVVEPSESPLLTLITCVEWDEEAEAYLKRLVLFADLVRVDPTLQGSSY